MKWIIYSLLLVNLGAAVWHYRMPLLAIGSVEQSQNPSTPELILLSERTPLESEVEGDHQRCYSLGPFSSETRADQAARLLAKQGLEVERKKSSERVREGFWVLLPPAESREAARATIEQLKQKGEKDFFLVVTGDQLNGISLGVFSQTESAQRRLAQVKKMGFSPVVQTISLPNTDYWLQWPRTAPKTISDELILQLKQKNQEIGIVERRCEQD
jgi:hypothetical protein